MDSTVEYCQSGCLFDVAQCRCPVIVRHVRLYCVSACIRPLFLLLLLLLLPLLLLLLPPVVGQLWTLWNILMEYKIIKGFLLFIRLNFSKVTVHFQKSLDEKKRKKLPIFFLHLLKKKDQNINFEV
ncbi:hypothetical protein T07_14300 [Trichinella nelsoni]|uniref:Uncharacterized protein n=1 Tax=Trichinella nelsoni TaxID=6336 RepID=A0A0V0RGP0_9BILA|nr:hypothetical protein T07_14300 [Trichinella nelsoni]